MTRLTLWGSTSDFPDFQRRCWKRSGAALEDEVREGQEPSS